MCSVVGTQSTGFKTIGVDSVSLPYSWSTPNTTHCQTLHNQTQGIQFISLIGTPGPKVDGSNKEHIQKMNRIVKYWGCKPGLGNFSPGGPLSCKV